MRHALAAAFFAACLSATCAGAAVGDFGPHEAAFAASPQLDGASLHHETPLIGSTLRLAVDMIARPAAGRLGGGGRLRLQSSALNFYPFEDSGFRLTLGARRERSIRTALRAFTGRGDRSGSFGSGFNGRQRLSPGVGFGYDAKLDGVTRISFDGGIALQHRDAGLSRLVRLANLSDRSMLLGAPAARFGPVMRVRLVRSF